MRRRLLLAAAAVALALAGCGGGDDAGGEPGKVYTGEYGTVIIEAASAPAGLEMSTQDSSMYAKPTATTPKEMLGRTIGASCRVDPPADEAGLPLIKLLWREKFGDWGATPFGYDTEKLPSLAKVIRSCDLRQGEPTGVPGEVDLNAGEPFGTVRFRQP